MTNRERLLYLAREGSLADDYLPAAFFLHFPDDCHAGPAAVRKHVEFFNATGNDLVKVQYERRFPALADIRRPSDWARLPCYDAAFYAEPLDVVAGVVDELGGTAVVIVTLYSPFMFAGHVVGKERLLSHFAEDPAAVRSGLDVIAESLRHFVGGCIERGVDGFYASTQGGEVGRLDAELFGRYVKPTDLAVWELFRERTQFNVLHVCDYAAPYQSFEQYTDYPGHIVSAPVQLADRRLPGRDVARLFGRPFLGGLDRLGAISHGPPDAIVREAEQAIRDGPEAMILGADCTLAAGADWNDIATATGVAHAWKRN